MDMAPDFNTIDDLEVEGKTVLVRVDINSPVDPLTGLLLDDTRIRLHAETIAELANKGAKTVIIAHQSRPGKKKISQHWNSMLKPFPIYWTGQLVMWMIYLEAMPARL